MTELELKAVNKALGIVDDASLRTHLSFKPHTIYLLATMKNRMRKNPSVFGICTQIGNTDLVRVLSPSWKHFSGNCYYPVPGKTRSDNPQEAYLYDYTFSDKWKGQQKRYRFSLIDHLLKNAPIFYKAVEERLK